MSLLEYFLQEQRSISSDKVAIPKFEAIKEWFSSLLFSFLYVSYILSTFFLLFSAFEFLSKLKIINLFIPSEIIEFEVTAKQVSLILHKPLNAPSFIMSKCSYPLDLSPNISTRAMTPFLPAAIK